MAPTPDGGEASPATTGVTESVLHAVEARYLSVFRAMLNGLAYCKVLTDGPPPHDFVYIEVNDAFETLTGLKDVAGKKASDVIPGIRESDPWLLDLYAEVADTGQPRRFERHLAALDEWFSVSVYSPAKGYFVAVFDVTTKARVVEESLRSSETLFRVAFETAAVGMALMSPDGRPLRVNEALRGMLGYSEQELLKVNWRDITHPDDLAASTREAERVEKAPEGGGRQEKRYVRKDGSIVWAEAATRAVFGPDGKVRHFISSVTDVTARRQAEEALRESEQHFRQLANEIPVGIFQVRPNGDMQFVNPTWLKITGLSESEAFGPHAGDAIHPADRERVTRLWQGAISSGNVFADEYRLRSRDGGEETWVQGFGTAVRDQHGVVTSYVGALVDISEARRLQAELAQASRLAAMGTLVAGVAHEINNPLAATLANQGLALELARAAKDGIPATNSIAPDHRPRDLEEIIEVLTEAQESGHRIAQIVRDMASFANPNPKRTPVRLLDVVHGAMRWLSTSTVQSAKIEVEDGGAPDVLAASGQLEQVVHNLITNAARASPEKGEIVVRIGPGSSGMARVEVMDHGVGIPDRVFDRIFEPFYTTRPVGEGRGAGLWLAISRAIVIAHGGSISVKSEVGKGSTFRVELPAAYG